MSRWTASDWVQTTRDVAGLSGVALMLLGMHGDAAGLAPFVLGCFGVWLACESARLWRGWPRI